ncbi:helicase SNF2 [Prauserella sp. PE36]|uniref:DEAD/DEAH box helicase n=1 Tax=Prauserella sp. PE36 TaxID=1504709 RepID=UPI000DE4BEE0|nr:SNF2-related protein [Prauserella sp. PE36]RBM18665.1 helicase SNF2 [Prauserella sp. PE36]
MTGVYPSPQAGAGVPQRPRKPAELARQVIAQVQDLAARGARLLQVPQALRQSAKQQTATLLNEQVHAELHRRPVADLRTLVEGRVRLGSLENAGYRTVADIHQVNPAQLLRVPGVGSHTAHEAAAAAGVLARQLAKESRIRLDLVGKPIGHTQLLATLAAARHADGAASALRGPIQQFQEQTASLIPEAGRATSKWRMTFAGRRKKDTALGAVGTLQAILDDPNVVALRNSVYSAEQATDPRNYQPEQLWQDYAADAATFNALLSTVGGAGESEDREAAEGFIGPELRQKISAEPLDTSLLNATLREYQAFGAKYAIHQQRSILGDEMGLGKTVESLAVFAHMAAKGQHRFMVICPASVQINWMKEIERHTDLAAHLLHGRDREAAGKRWLRTGGVAVTTFTTVGSLECLEEAEIAMVVVDEAHYVKNPDAKRSQAVAEVLERSQRALFLTGTPMENRVEEFRNLVAYLQPGLAARIDPADAIAGARAFRRAVAPVYLRRNQEDVLTELPDKIEVEDWVQLSWQDEEAYREAVKAKNLMGMRRAAFDSPDSAKLQRIREIIEEAVEDGRKVIVFSYFLDVLGAIQRTLGDIAMGPLTGSVPPAMRQRFVDDFSQRQGSAVLLSQIEAGGVGLNVQAASVVVIAEPQWKPSIEEQAIARAHRMGQIHTVQVHRILAKGSVDERIREIQEHKQLLFNEFARKSDAKDADARSVDTSEHRPAVLDDESVPTERRVILAEQYRLGVL